MTATPNPVAIAEAFGSFITSKSTRSVLLAAIGSTNHAGVSTALAKLHGPELNLLHSGASSGGDANTKHSCHLVAELFAAFANGTTIIPTPLNEAAAKIAEAFKQVAATADNTLECLALAHRVSRLFPLLVHIINLNHNSNTAAAITAWNDHLTPALPDMRIWCTKQGGSNNSNPGSNNSSSSSSENTMKRCCDSVELKQQLEDSCARNAMWFQDAHEKLTTALETVCNNNIAATHENERKALRRFVASIVPAAQPTRVLQRNCDAKLRAHVAGSLDSIESSLRRDVLTSDQRNRLEQVKSQLLLPRSSGSNNSASGSGSALNIDSIHSLSTSSNVQHSGPIINTLNDGSAPPAYAGPAAVSFASPPKQDTAETQQLLRPSHQDQEKQQQQQQQQPEQEAATREMTVSSERLRVHENVVLGSGSFGVVNAATLDGQDVAAKKLHKNDTIFISELRKEAMLMRDLDAPTILRCYGVCHKMNGSVFLVMDRCFCSASQLQDLLPPVACNGVFSVAATLSMMSDIASALIRMHGKNLVHRDIKPDNLLISINNRGRLCAKLSDLGSVNTSRGTVIAENHKQQQQNVGAHGMTAGFIAPEIRNNATAVATDKADIYALGATAYFFLRRSEPDFPDDPVDDVKKLLRSCVAAKPESRPTAQELADRLSVAKSQCPLLSNDEESLRKIAETFDATRPKPTPPTESVPPRGKPLPK